MGYPARGRTPLKAGVGEDCVLYEEDLRLSTRGVDVQKHHNPDEKPNDKDQNLAEPVVRLEQ